MRRITALVFAAVPLLLASLAFGGGRTFNLATILKGRQVSLGRTEKSVTLRAPRNTRISRSMGGMTGTFVTVKGKLSTDKKSVLVKAPAGHYYASPQNRVFDIFAPPPPRTTAP